MSKIPSSALVSMGRRLAEARLRPDGRAIGWVQRASGPAELIVRELGNGGDDTDGPEVVITTQPTLLGPHADGGGAWCWTPDSASVIYVAADGLWQVPSSGGVAVHVVAAVPGRTLWSPCVSRDGLMVAFVDESETDARVCVAAVGSGSHVSGGPTTRLDRVANEVSPKGRAMVRVVSEADTGFVLDPDWGDDGLLAWHGWSAPAMPWDRSWIEIVRVPLLGDVDRVDRISGGSVGQPRWRGDRLCWVDDRSGWLNVHARTAAGSEHVHINEAAEHAGPTWGPGQRSTAWSPTGNEIVFERNEEGFGRLVLSAVKPSSSVGESTTMHETVTLGRGVHRSLSWAMTSDGVHRIAAIRQGATTPVQLVVYERSGGLDGVDEAGFDTTQPWVRRSIARGPVGGWESLDLVEPSVIRWTIDSGETIPGRLYRPTAAVGALPTVVGIHGGPTDQSRVAWNPRFAAYVAAGWQVFVPDHRGSTGWGREFQQAMNHGWGNIDVADTAAGIRHLVDEGLANPHQVVAMGGSAGGFTALGLLAFEPSVCGAGVVLYPVTDLIALDETTHRFEAQYNQTLVGPRNVGDLAQQSADVQRYLDRSPMHFVDRINAPLLMFHGTADRVVSIEQSDAFVAALQARGISVDYVRFEDEGHGWSNATTTMAEHSQIMGFLEGFLERS
jgi:acetyl esterase/lipase